ncbi:MAG TPA: TadE/TadG family type IV pilus assembly protein [Microvirga sp.]|jgi:Flp pilus assembly protein TadG|nr:TadE/TadG family type IV pilus assembly protein [Microvirga sp.]
MRAALRKAVAAALRWPPVARLQRELVRFRDAVEAVAAIEFALILPVMITMYFGMTELTVALMQDRKVNIAANTVADMMGKVSQLSPDELEQIMRVAETIMAPFDASGLKVTVSSVVVRARGGSGNGNGQANGQGGGAEARVCWSRKVEGRGRGLALGRAEDDVVTQIPPGFDVPGASFTLTEVESRHKPMVGYALTGEFTLSEVKPWPNRSEDDVEYNGKRCNPRRSS